MEDPPSGLEPFGFSGTGVPPDVAPLGIPDLTPSPTSSMSALSAQGREWETASAQSADEGGMEGEFGPESQPADWPARELDEPRMSSFDRPSPRPRPPGTVPPGGVRPEAPRPADVPVRGPRLARPEPTALSPVSDDVPDRPRRTRLHIERPTAESREELSEQPAAEKPREQTREGLGEQPAEATEGSERPAESKEVPERPAEATEVSEPSADVEAETVGDVREGPSADPIGSLLSQVRELDRSALTLLAPLAQLGSSEWQLVEARLERVADLIDRLERLPLVPEANELAERLTRLGRTDVRACLREITQVCQSLGAPELRWETDTDGWIALLDVAVRRLEQRGNPEVTVLRGPGGVAEGSAPPRAIKDLTVRDSRAVTYGVGNTLHVVHRCAVERPVIEVATLLDYDEATDTDSWFHSAEPVRATGAEDMRTRITHSSGVSIGHGNHQRSVFTHRIPTCAVNLGVVVSMPAVRQALLDHRLSGGTPETMAALLKAVRRAVHGVDVSALVPDGMVARLAAAQEKAPSLRGHGPTLTIRHGAGVAVGWDTQVIYDEQYHVGKPKVQ
ncbi:hypothetical protein AB0J83_43095 [Actinoplanes sp. NPDC049596]|uniref:hypothetical protein n=1 Tax=unclassified Actinoplanes TaxID=2626549 RepID=UPI00342C05B5